MRNNIFTAILAVAVVVLLYILLTREAEGNKGSAIEPIAREAVQAEVKNVKSKLDKEGFHHAVMSDKENVIQSVTQLDTSARRERDSVVRLLGIKDKQLNHWISYSTTLEGKLLKASKTDTSYKYSDKWANIEYVVPKDTLSSGHFNFAYNAEINYAEYSTRKHFLAPKRNYIDFWINDTRATINGVKRIKIEPKKDNFGVEVNASSFYTDRLNLGVDGAVRMGRTKVGGGYFYDMLDGKWKPLVSVKYNLLDF